MDPVAGFLALSVHQQTHNGVDEGGGQKWDTPTPPIRIDTYISDVVPNHGGTVEFPS